MSAQHTPGPWHWDSAVWDYDPEIDAPWLVDATDKRVLWGSIKCDSGANARLIAAAPDLLAAVESEYIFLADIRNEWPGRCTVEGQQKLCRLRDLICKATGREAWDVQDDYGNRNVAKTEGAAS
jgi:hypothetical protein